MHTKERAFHSDGHPVRTKRAICRRPAQIEFMFSLRVNTTWRHIDDLLTLQGLWDVDGRQEKGLCKRTDLHTCGLKCRKMFFMLQRRPKVSIVMGTSQVSAVFFLFLFMKITKTFITCLSDSLTWPIVCLRALSSLTCKIMRVIFQERQRDQENNRNVFECVSSFPVFGGQQRD